MYVSDMSFPHLQADREARLTREREWRRIADERRADVADAAAATTGAGGAAPSGRAWLRRWRRHPARVRDATT
ncbi:hypothetical protein [Agromyces sp. NPDC049794]|uniref:hypothetical protein n=1 Tax=unclassified Agromyces TaxID=2639701 RepID=UPI0033E3E630